MVSRSAGGRRQTSRPVSGAGLPGRSHKSAQKKVYTMRRRIQLVAIVALLALRAAAAQECSHPQDPAFYATNGYTVRTVQMKSPFDFIFLVRQRFNLIKGGLPLKEGDKFSADAYNQNFTAVEEAVKKDSAFGEELPAKVVVVTGGLGNCVETDSSPTVDIVYRIFSTDPIPAVAATPEERRATVVNEATAIAEQNTKPDYKIVPRFSYDRTRRGFGGVDFVRRLPGRMVDSFELSAQGSSASRSLYGELHGGAQPRKGMLDRAEYSLAYSFDDSPALNLRLAKGAVSGRFLGLSKPLIISSARIGLRYGITVEQGNQQSNSPAGPVPANTLTNSAYGAVKLYTGVTASTRYSESAISYGLQAGGAGLSNMGFAKQIGDISYGARFPGGTHRPWDVSVRATAGAITGGGPIPINDRFFGGNSIATFIPGDSWRIPNGPLVRSIAANRLSGAGFGGTSFYSANLTVGKVILGWPIIPSEVENADGFDAAVRSAEDSAQNWFADDYEAGSPEFKQLLVDFPSRLKADLDAAQAAFVSIRAAGPVSVPLDSALKAAEREARLAQNMVGHVTDPDARGPDNANKLRAWLVPASRFRKLATELQTVEPLIPATTATHLDATKESIEAHLKDLGNALAGIRASPVRAAAVQRAQQDMVRPREVIDTLRHEANRFSIGLVGVVDAGRLWPDPFGTRYAFGGGVRASVVNVNFTLGYAVNPSPHRELGQGRGAVFFSITYTNLFR